MCPNGRSFGGILAQEIANIIPVNTLVLLASVKSFRELPYYTKMLPGKITTLMPAKLFLRPNCITYWFFGANQKETKNYLSKTLKQTTPQLFKWSIAQITNWKGDYTHLNTVHIHGAKDRILLCKNTKPNFVIPKGGHLFTLTHAEEINKVLYSILRK